MEMRTLTMTIISWGNRSRTYSQNLMYNVVLITKLLFFTEIFLSEILMIFDIEIIFESPILALFDKA